MKLPYLEIAPGYYEPIINVGFRTRERWINTEAYVDTGASYSIFHANFLSLLNISIKHGKKLLITVGDGGLIPVYIHNLRV